MKRIGLVIVLAGLMVLAFSATAFAGGYDHDGDCHYGSTTTTKYVTSTTAETTTTQPEETTSTTEATTTTTVPETTTTTVETTTTIPETTTSTPETTTSVEDTTTTEATTTVPVTEATQPPGDTNRRGLPRTGSSSVPLAGVGTLFFALGLVLVKTSTRKA